MNIRTVTSPKSLYHINKERYLELKHFCLQYHSWQVEADLIEYASSTSFIELNDEIKEYSDNVFEYVSRRSYYLSKIEKVDKAVVEATDNKDIRAALLECVTTGRTYAKMNARHQIPCGRGQFYDVYRRFFYILDKMD